MAESNVSAESVEQLKVKAAQGDIIAQSQLGLMYDTGNVVVQDYKERENRCWGLVKSLAVKIHRFRTPDFATLRLHDEAGHAGTLARKIILMRFAFGMLMTRLRLSLYVR